MVERSKQKQGTKTSMNDFVTVAFAEDMELAKQYKEMLKESEIQSVIKAPNDLSSFPGIAVMVSENDLDEAHVLIESQGSSDSFFDLAFSEDDSNDLDEDLYLDDELDDTLYSDEA